MNDPKPRGGGMSTGNARRNAPCGKNGSVLGEPVKKYVAGSTAKILYANQVGHGVTGNTVAIRMTYTVAGKQVQSNFNNIVLTTPNLAVMKDNTRAV